MMQNFKTGDLVTLNSGGPPMTVLRTLMTGCGRVAYCRWMDGATVQEQPFNVDMLTPYVPPSVGLSAGTSWVTKANPPEDLPNGL